MTNVEIVQSIFEQRKSGKHDALENFLDEDVQWTIMGTSPVSRLFKGKKDFLENAVAKVRDRLASAIKVTVSRILSDGDYVIVEWEGKSTNLAGGTYNNSYCWILKFHKSRIVEGTAYVDTQLLGELFE